MRALPLSALVLFLSLPLRAQQEAPEAGRGTSTPASGNCGQPANSTSEQLKGAIAAIYADAATLSEVMPPPALRFEARRDTRMAYAKAQPAEIHYNPALCDIARSEAETAFILAHELAHFKLGHFDPKLAEDAAAVSARESAADSEALRILSGNASPWKSSAAKAGAAFFGHLQDLYWALDIQDKIDPDHPSPSRRRLDLKGAATAMSSKAGRMADALGRTNETDGVAGAVGAAGGAGAAARARAGQALAGRGLNIRSVPPTFHAMSDDSVAPEPSWLDRAASLKASDAGTIAEDFRTINAKAASFSIPPTVESRGTTNDAALGEFADWLRTVKPDDVPPIDYAILSKGEIGRYSPPVLGKGTIYLNHFIRGAEPEARAAVLVHELYHYWDSKVARNHYENVSYGMIGAGHIQEHEYNAYLLTALWWRQEKPDNPASPLSRMLDKLPTETEANQALVDRQYGK